MLGRTRNAPATKIRRNQPQIDMPVATRAGFLASTVSVNDAIQGA